MALIFLFNLWEQEVLLQNSERSACDLQLFWAYRKLIETKNGKRSYGRFVNVVIGVIIISLLLVFLWKSRCFYTCFCTACCCFPCNNFYCDVVHELSSVWRLCIFSKFCKGVY